MGLLNRVFQLAFSRACALIGIAGIAISAKGASFARRGAFLSDDRMRRRVFRRLVLGNRRLPSTAELVASTNLRPALALYVGVRLEADVIARVAAGLAGSPGANRQQYQHG